MATPQRAVPSTKPSRSSRAAGPVAPAVAPPTAAMIAARAYEIWQAAGCPQGCDTEHWFQAESELRGPVAN